MAELHELTATEAAEQIRSKNVSPVELVQALLARVDRLEPRLRAWVTLDAELTKDEPNKTLGWNSAGGEMGTSGAVTFAETGDNTEVHVVMQWFDPPGGAVGEDTSKLLQDPEKMLEEDLQRFKDIAEGRIGSGLMRK